MIQTGLEDSLKFAPFSTANVTRSLDVGAVALALLGVVVMVGWYAGIRNLVQLHPSFVPMQFNTALGFCMLGVALVALNHNWQAIARPLALLLITLGGLTLVEYIFRVNLGIDELFMDHYIVTATSHPGRMAPNTAFNFILCGNALILLTWRPSNLDRFLLATIFSALVFGLGCVVTFGYMSNIETAYGWGKLTKMALHTSLGFIVASLLLIARMVQLSFQRFQRLPMLFLPTTAAIAGITVTLALWQALDSLENQLCAPCGTGGAEENLIIEAILVGGFAFSGVLAIAIWFAEKSQQQLHHLRFAQAEIVELNRRLEKLSYLDGLTGIANRRMFDITIEKEWGRALRHSGSVALIFLDIDYFKLYNDHYGHQQGDACLQQVAQTLNQMARRTTDLAARYGGEEFVLLLPDTTVGAAQAIAEKLVEAVRTRKIAHCMSPISPIVTISAGVCALIPHVDVTFEILIQKADQALYEAKHQGRNRATVFNPDTQTVRHCHNE